MPKPTRAEKRAQEQAEELEAQMEARGADDATLANLNESPAAQLGIYSHTTIKTFAPLRREFDTWAAQLYTKEQLDPEVVFAPQSKFRLTYGHLSSFLLYHTSNIVGRSGDTGEEIRYGTIITFWTTFKACYRYYTGTALPKQLGSQVRAYIRDDLSEEFNLNRERPIRPFVPLSTFKVMVFFLLSPIIVFFSTRQRWQALLGLGVMMNSGMRAGSFWRVLQDESDKNDLLWGALTLSIFRTDQGLPNRLVIRFLAPNGKTANARDSEVIITQSDTHWYDALLFILVLANAAGALPAGWTVERLYDPAIFHDSDKTQIDLAFDKPDEPVFILHRSEKSAEKIPWTGPQFRAILSRVSKKMGLARPIATHVIRRSMHLALKVQGKSLLVVDS